MPKQSNMHESYHRDESVVGPSDRHFAFSFAAIFLVFSVLGYWQSFSGSGVLAGLAIVFCLTGLAAPQLVRPLNRAWLKLGLVLYRLVNPVMMAIMYFGMIVPMGILLRLLGKDLLNRKADPGAESYWVRRTPAGPSPESLKNQF